MITPNSTFRGFQKIVSVLLAAGSGLITQSFFAPLAHPFPAEVAQAPDNSLNLTLRAIESAKNSILLNCYQMSSPQIGNALIDKALAGVKVEILLEGHPVSGISAGEATFRKRLVQALDAANNGSKLYIMESDKAGERRYRYDHAKYIVVDESSVLVSSENFNGNGTPSGKRGNRGWQVLLHSPKTAKTFVAFFRKDADHTKPDVVDLGNEVPSIKRSQIPSTPMPATRASDALDVANAQVIASPDTSNSGIQKLIEAAKNTLDIEQMSFDSDFGRGGAAPFFTAVLAAAKRGVKVRVLVSPDMQDATTNSVTVKALNDAAKKNHYPLEARLANLSKMGVELIHNKGVIADSRYTLVSSINWTFTSINKNRETGVILDSPSASKYFGSRFTRDWTVSAAP